MSLTTSFLVPGNAQEMVDYYQDVFKDSELIDSMRIPGPDGSETLVTAVLRLRGTDVLFVNGGENKGFTESMSLVINCENQDEVDHFWSRFVGDGGNEIACGWCNDKFGVFWQVIPVEMPALLGDPDPERAGKAMAAMNEMYKIDLAGLKAAMDSKGENHG